MYLSVEVPDGGVDEDTEFRGPNRLHLRIPFGNVVVPLSSRPHRQIRMFRAYHITDVLTDPRIIVNSYLEHPLSSIRSMSTTCPRFMCQPPRALLEPNAKRIE